MKPLSLIAIIATITLPAMATEKSSDDAIAQEMEVAEVEQISNPVTEIKQIAENPNAKFPNGLQLGIGLSATSGANGFVGYANKNLDSFWLKRFGVRFDFATTAPLKSAINKGVDDMMGDDGLEITDDIKLVDGSIKAQHMAALIDFYPFGNTWFLGGWRLTGGYVLGKLDMDADLKGTLRGVPGEPIEFELWHQKYKYEGGNTAYGTATMDWKVRGPYAGTGFDLGLLWGIKIYMDAGVVFTSRAAQIDMNIPVEEMASTLYKWNSYINNWEAFGVVGTPEYELAVEEFNRNKDDVLKDARDELNKYKFYPIVKLGLMYRF